MGDINITGKYRVNGIPITTGEVGQTPWHSDIDAAQHELKNLKRVLFTNTSDTLPVHFGTGSCARYIYYNHSSGGGGDDRLWFLRENGSSTSGCEIGFADGSGKARLYLRKDDVSVADGGMYVHGNLDVTGNYEQNGTKREFPPTHTSSNNNQVLTIYNNQMEWRTPSTGGESQTPWLHNIDAANHTLTNLASLNGHSIIFVPSYSSSNNNQVLTVISGALQWHTPTAGGQNQTPWLSNIDANRHSLRRAALIDADVVRPNGQINGPDVDIGSTTGPGVEIGLYANEGRIQVFDRTLFYYPKFAIECGGLHINTTTHTPVGIGTDNPQYILDVIGDCNITGVYRVNGVQQYFVPNPTGITNGYVLTANNSAAQWMAPPSGGGSGFNLKGFVDKHQDLPTTGNSVGDAYVTENSGELWVWDGSDWFNAGKFTPEIDIREHQSPWLVDIDADDHNLINVNQIDCSSIYIDGAPVPLPSHIVLNTGSYANPAWITSLAWSKITGAPAIPAQLWTPWGTGAIYTNDKVGVNTNDLAYQFEVAGRVRLKPYSGATAGIWFNATARADAFFLGEANGDFRLYSAYSAGNVLYFTGATNRAGFNMAAPNYTVDVNGDCNVAGVYRINGTAQSFPPTPNAGNSGNVLSVNSLGAMVWEAPSGGYQPINYSTTEQDTGIRWTDNKRVYQKTIITMFETLFDTYDVPHGVSLFEKLVDIHVDFYNYSNHQFVFPYIGHLGVSVGIYIVGGNVRFVCAGAGAGLSAQLGDMGQIYITLRYTKSS